MPRVVVVTGGAGFIGANLAHHYLGQGDRVVLYDTLGRKGCRENLGWLEDHPNAANLDVLIGDVRLPTRPLQAAIERADALFHLAAQVAVTTSVTRPRARLRGQRARHLQAARGWCGTRRPSGRSCSTPRPTRSTAAWRTWRSLEGEDRYAYRDLPDGIPEDRLLDFHSPYGCSKGAADQYVRDYARIYGLETVVFRQSCIYGYRQFGLEDQGWVAWFIIAAILGRPITVFGDGKQVRDVLFIDDLIAAYDRAWARIESTRGPSLQRRRRSGERGLPARPAGRPAHRGRPGARGRPRRLAAGRSAGVCLRHRQGRPRLRLAAAGRLALRGRPAGRLGT